MKTCFHSHFYTNYHEFYEGQLKQQFAKCVTAKLYTAKFNLFRLAGQFFMTVSYFPNFDGQNLFSQIQQAPGPIFRMVRKIPDAQKKFANLGLCTVGKAINFEILN